MIDVCCRRRVKLELQVEEVGRHRGSGEAPTVGIVGEIYAADEIQDILFYLYY